MRFGSSGQGSPFHGDDEIVRSALDSVEVPAGSRRRVLQQLRLEAARPGYESETIGERQAEVISPELARPQQPRALTRRRLLGLATAVAVGGLAVGYYRHSLPVSQRRVADHCISALEPILAGSVSWKKPAREHRSRLKALRLPASARLSLVGFLNTSGGALSKRCTIWKLTALSDGKSLYVLDFEKPQQVEDLSWQLRPIAPSSSGWSLRALQNGEQLLVIACQGDLERYIPSIPMA